MSKEERDYLEEAALNLLLARSVKEGRAPDRKMATQVDAGIRYTLSQKDTSKYDQTRLGRALTAHQNGKSRREVACIGTGKRSIQPHEIDKLYAALYYRFGKLVRRSPGAAQKPGRKPRK